MDLLQTGLSDENWTLSYDVTDSGVLVYLSKGKSLVKAVFKQIKRKEINELIRHFREPLLMNDGYVDGDRLAAFDFGGGKKMADILLADVISFLPSGAHVIVVPDDCLGALPFEMLVLSAGGRISTNGRIPSVSGADSFGDRNPISYCQSVTALAPARVLDGTRKHCTKTLVGDDPVFGPDDPRAQKEARSKEQISSAMSRPTLASIERRLGLQFPRLPLSAEIGKSLEKSDPTNTDRLSGFAASKRALLTRHLSSYRSVIFATHGYFGKEIPGIMEPVLVFTLVDQPKKAGGFLTMSEVMNLTSSMLIWSH